MTITVMSIPAGFDVERIDLDSEARAIIIHCREIGEPPPVHIRIKAPSGNVYLRYTPVINSINKIGMLYQNQIADVISKEGDWYKITAFVHESVVEEI